MGKADTSRDTASFTGCTRTEESQSSSFEAWCTTWKRQSLLPWKRRWVQ